MRLNQILNSRWTRWLVSLGLISVLLWMTDVQQIARSIALANWLWLAGAVLFMLFLTAFGAIKWWVLMPRSRSGPLTFIRINFISNFVGIFLPGIVGIEAARIAGVSKSSKDTAAAFASVLVDRLFGLFSLGLVIALGGLVSHELVPMAVTWGSATLLAGILLGSYLMMDNRFRQLLLRYMPARIAGALQKLFDCLDLYRNKKRLLLLSLCLSLSFQFLRVIMVYMIVISLDLTVDFRYLLIVVPVALFVQMLPFSISGIGIRESAMIALLAVVGISAEDAFALSILLLAVQLISVLPGGILFALGRKPS